jgi:hypothetical protein
MAKDLEYLAKSKAEEAEKRLEQGIDDAATSLRRKGREFQEYLKKLNAEVEEWKFEWRSPGTVSASSGAWSP